MTKRSEKASRQNHLFVVSKQLCSKLREEEGPNHNSSSLHSDADLTRAGWFGFDKSDWAPRAPQRGTKKLVGTGMKCLLLHQQHVLCFTFTNKTYFHKAVRFIHYWVVSVFEVNQHSAAGRFEIIFYHLMETRRYIWCTLSF